MSRAKEQWIGRTGGFRIGESPEEFRNRVAEIKKLESLFRSGRIKLDHLEHIQRRLCQLKGIDFDSYDPPDD